MLLRQLSEKFCGMFDIFGVDNPFMTCVRNGSSKQLLAIENDLRLAMVTAIEMIEWIKSNTVHSFLEQSGAKTNLRWAG